ncbi:RsmB/NOP family class I SAM-dependent RNA methyltransferase [Pseudohoeflea suaedae]|uniref:RsmB/NOP family class I SAM-dependent RNA methyltransferase n=1 Tax=Pseudohoeflea suaedae TaxID=877384 RepID=A0A4R5PLR7_9HYPH|nr:RsmB/NOP family class I SAM-dependent RNA methyltransferase [Pseudohoeflea suaedae]TDH37890.1 RsmB/NOP family class I SAM-dependent RNA methyltransferase [Pseudohoeflea suaedae]
MRLGGRIQAAAEVLADLAARHRPVPDALRDWGTSHRFAGSGDRAAISNLVLDVLRMKASHAWLMDDEAPLSLVTASLLRQWDFSPESLAGELGGDKFAPELKSPEDLATLIGKDLGDAPEHIQADIPEWTVGHFKAAFGETWLAEAQALAGRAPLDLRVNTLKAGREKVLRGLQAPGAHETRFAPDGIRVPAPEGPRRQAAATSEVAFAKGWFEVQDEGSQLAALLTGAQPGEQVLDYCAGGGGKTLAMAASMENSGQIHAYDSDRRRLAPMVERLKRGGVRNVQLIEAAEGLSPLKGRMDRVLIDAPCTGTGTWRRRPDAKWRLSEDNLASRMADQDEVLDKAAAFVKPGGVLAYVTCSVLPQENTDRTAAFLTRNPGFETLEAARLWSDKVGAETNAPLAADKTGLLLSPARTETDGFFLSVFKRRA